MRRRAEPRVALAVYENRGGLLPRDAPGLRAEARRLAAAPVNVRVSLRWVEVLVFRPLTRREALELGARLHGLGRLVRLRVGEPEPPPGRLVAVYRMLLVENRFWEAHVAGEAAWRRLGGPWRVLAVIPGAFARAQEGEPEPGLRMLLRSREWLAAHGLEGLVDWEALKGELRRVHRLGWGWPLPALEPLIQRAERLLDGALHQPAGGEVEQRRLGDRVEPAAAEG